jgi:hypothetical protein
MPAPNRPDYQRAAQNTLRTNGQAHRIEKQGTGAEDCNIVTTIAPLQQVQPSRGHEAAQEK